MRGCFLSAFFITAAVANVAIGEPPRCDPQGASPARSVAQVLDGETLLLHDGSQLRLADILPPRASDVGAKAGTWPSEVSARAELEALALGKSVLLSATGSAHDRYGRHVAHVFVEDEGKRIWLQAQLIRQGLARVLGKAPQDACARALLEAEAGARKERRGLWAEAAYDVRRADAPDVLIPLRGTFQVVEGRVGQVTRSRADLRLALGETKRRFALRIRLPTAVAREAEKDQARITEGTMVRVRGWLEERSDGPVIDLSLGGSLELLQARPDG